MAEGVRMRSMLAATVVLAACGGTTGQIAEMGPDRPPCPEVGEVLIEEAASPKGCWDGQTTQVLGVHNCEDGRQLWSEGDRWAWVGEPVQQTDGDAAASDAYSGAYDDCLG